MKTGSLEFDAPRKIIRSALGQIHRDYIRDLDKGHYERGCSVITKWGIVLVSELKWEHNEGLSEFTRFTAIIDGIIYSAWHDSARRSDRNIRWMATHFIKKVLIAAEKKQ